MNNEIIKSSLNRALGGGLAGSLAMTTQVCSLMWLRTTMNYQYRYGTSTSYALKTLYKDGGIPRFYRGIIPALFQGSLARFGDTAANTGIIYYLNNNPSTKDLPLPLKSAFCSLGASSWRVFIMPIDTLKTSLQVDGKKGINILKKKINTNSPRVLYNGAIAASSASFIGNYPWFFTFNYLNEYLPNGKNKLENLARNGFIGFSSSLISDTCSNSIRVIKTIKQTHKKNISYHKVVNERVAKDGIKGLFFRGLKTRILANGLQSSMFSITWKYFEKEIGSIF